MIAIRDWENDWGTPAQCPDIASQLVRNKPGNRLKVILWYLILDTT